MSTRHVHYPRKVPTIKKFAVRTIREYVPLEVKIQFSAYTDNELRPFVNSTNLKKDQRDLKASFKIFVSSLHLISIIF